MKAKEKELVRETFKEEYFRIFKSNAEAQEMSRLLDELEVPHTVGDYLCNDGSRSYYRNGIQITNAEKLQQALARKEKTNGKRSKK